VLGGLLTSTFLTLLVIPVVYTLIENIIARLRHAPVPVPGAAPAPVSGASNGEEDDPRGPVL
jgi:hypothetical protein